MLRLLVFYWRKWNKIMTNPFKLILIVSSTISPVETNKVYYLPKDYSYEASVIMMQKRGDSKFLSDILYKQIHKENCDKSE